MRFFKEISAAEVANQDSIYKNYLSNMILPSILNFLICYGLWTFGAHKQVVFGALILIYFFLCLYRVFFLLKITDFKHKFKGKNFNMLMALFLFISAWLAMCFLVLGDEKFLWAHSSYYRVIYAGNDVVDLFVSSVGVSAGAACIFFVFIFLKLLLIK